MGNCFFKIQNLHICTHFEKLLQGYALWALQKTVNALEERANVSSQIKVTFQIVYCRSNFLGMKKNSSIASPYSSL